MILLDRNSDGTRRSLRFVAASAYSLAAVASAQDLTHHAPPQSAPIAIVNATIHPVSGPAIARGHIAFDQGRITAVGPGDYTPAGPGTVIDATGKHIYPGLITACTQLGLSEVASVRATLDFAEVGTISPEAMACTAINPDSALIPVARANGILLAGVFPSSSATIPGRPSFIQLEGWTWEEMTIAPALGIIVNWPFMRTVSAPWMDQGDTEQRDNIRRQLDAIDEVFDAAEAYFKARAADSETPTDIRFEAMRACLTPAESRPAQQSVFISAQDLDQITAAVTWATSRKLRAAIVGGRDAPLCAELLKLHDVPVIVTGTHVFPKRADAAYDDGFTLPARLEAAGVRWCLAAGEEPAHERSLPYHAATAVAYGLPEEAAIRAITLAPAQILGVGDRVGSLEPGKDATLIVTTGNPLEITTRVERAFIAGRDVDLSNKQTELAEKYREKYRQADETKGPADSSGR